MKKPAEPQSTRVLTQIAARLPTMGLSVGAPSRPSSTPSFRRFLERGG